MKTNYIVAFYGGYRRNQLEPTPLKLFLENHINFLNTNPKGIDHATFVFNQSNNPEEKEVINLANQANLPIPHKVIVRENYNFSYGAWGEGMKQTHQDFDYSFLIEDDYIPYCNDFLDYFKSKITDKIIFVASMFHTVNGPHAAISNGLFINKFINPDNPIDLKLNHPDGRYHEAAYNQIKFLLQYQEKGYLINDIRDVGYTIFKDLHKFTKYNNPKLPLLIIPHDYDPTETIN